MCLLSVVCFTCFHPFVCLDITEYGGIIVLLKQTCINFVYNSLFIYIEMSIHKNTINLVSKKR